MVKAKIQWENENQETPCGDMLYNLRSRMITIITHTCHKLVDYKQKSANFQAESTHLILHLLTPDWTKFKSIFYDIQTNMHG